MTPHLARVADTAPQPWRNGGGSTRELLAWPSATPWQLRLSVADIAADGPFSVFAGVQRWFAVLQGAGVALTIDGHTHRQLLGYAPLCFDGAASTDCRLLDGPTQDLNLMLRQCSGGLLPALPGQSWQPPGAVCGLFARSAGQCHITPTHGTEPSTLAVPAMALLWFDGAPARLGWQPAAPDTLPQAWWLWAATERPGP